MGLPSDVYLFILFPVEDMELQSIIQTHPKYEKKRTEFDPAARENSKILIETIQNAPRSVEAIQALMDAKEVAMNQTGDILQGKRSDTVQRIPHATGTCRPA